MLRARDRLARCAHHLAAGRGDRAALTACLDALPGLRDEPDGAGRPALWLACARACATSGPAREAMLATMDLLMRRGADPNLRDAARGETLLGWLARRGEATMIRRVLRDFDGAWGPRANPALPDTHLRRAPLDWVALRATPAAGEEGPAPWDPACAVALVDGGAPVAGRHAALLAAARAAPLPPVHEHELEKSLQVLHARLQAAARAALVVHDDDDDDDDAAVERLEAHLGEYSASGALTLAELHAAIRGALRVRPSKTGAALEAGRVDAAPDGAIDRARTETERSPARASDGAIDRARTETERSTARAPRRSDRPHARARRSDSPRARPTERSRAGATGASSGQCRACAILYLSQVPGQRPRRRRRLGATPPGRPPGDAARVPPLATPRPRAVGAAPVVGAPEHGDPRGHLDHA